MTILDAQALIAYLRGEPAQDTVTAVLRDGDAALGAPNLAEAVDVLTRRYGVSRERLRTTLDPLLDQTIQVLPFEQLHAWRAGELRAAHYHRSRRPLSAADCSLLALATGDDRVASSDTHLLAVAEAEGIATLALPQAG